MATFPTLNPSSRVFSPGEYPHTPFIGMSGRQNRVRSSNVMLSSQLRLTFVAITEAQMLSILAHYQGQQGSFASFLLPSLVWSGVNDLADYQLVGYGWIYKEPPLVTDSMCGGFFDVELSLETVPPEGTAILGLDQRISVILVAGGAYTAGAANLITTWRLRVGAAGVAGMTATMTWTLTAGAPTGAVLMPGAQLHVFTNLQIARIAASDGVALSEAYALAAGAATNGIQDASFSSVSLLLHLNGSNTSTTFTDNSSNAFTITKTGQVTTSTTQSKFNGSSGYFNGYNGNLTQALLTAPNNSALAFGTGGFTIEVWLYKVSTSEGTIISSGSFSSASASVYIDSNRKIVFQNSNQYKTSTDAITLNQWTHIAVTRSGTTLYIFIDGQASGSFTVSANMTEPVRYIGQYSTSQTFIMNGYMADLRVTKGVARYTSTFTPPSAAFPDS